MNVTTSGKSFYMHWVLPVIFSFFSGSALVHFLGLATTNIISLIFMILLIPIYRASLKITDKKITTVSMLCGALYMTAMVFSRIGDIQDKLYGVFVIFSFLLGFYLLFRNLTGVMFSYLQNADCTENQRRTVTRKNLLAFFVCSICIMLLCWLPYFLRFYPGDLTTDSHDQLVQIVGSEPLSNHHPVAHTMMIKFFYSVGMALFNDQTKAVATYSVCQSILLAASFSYLLTTMYQFNVRRAILIVSLAFYSLVPYHGVYSIVMWKDIPFGGVVAVISTTIWRLFRHFDSGNKGIPVFESIMLFIFGTAMCLLRSNGLYAYILLVVFLFIIFWKKSKLTSALAAAALAVALIVIGPIYDAMGVIPDAPIFSLSLPAQHIAATITRYGTSALTDEQYELLSHIIDVERIPEMYEPTCSNNICFRVNEIGDQEYLVEHKAEYFKLWLDLGLKYQPTYLRAHIDQTYGYWYPDVQFWIYPIEFRGSGDGYSLDRHSLIPESASNMMTPILYSYRTVPYLGLVWSIGTATWIFVFMMGICYIKRKMPYLLVYIPVLAILATLMLATPSYAEFRYIYGLFTTLPLFCVVPFCSFEEDDTLGKAAAAQDRTDTEMTDGKADP